MFTTDKPICKSEDDLLNRENFSKHLANALLNSKETENLVVALCGKWGSGKSSIINLAKEHIEKIEIENKPTIINFNPWHFSGLNNLIHYFFDEIAKELELKQTGKQASKIAESLKFYGEILSVVSEAKPATDLVKDILLYSSIASFAIPEIMSWLGLSIEQLKKIGLIIGIGFTFTAIAKNFIFRLSNLYSQKAELNKISTDKLKEKISKELKEINNKIIIVIDDIDRLTKDEIRQLFQLIKINADFPNVIYLLAFDREIVEHNLTVQDGFSGKDYLEKIVQVFFDIPYVTPAKIHELLYK
jgi:predicted KAP-like P-loop ATPase